LKQIHTREQLERAIEDILDTECYLEEKMEYEEWEINYGFAVRKICDLIADLNSNCYHEHIE